jgi:hypothetical protein
MSIAMGKVQAAASRPRRGKPPPPLTIAALFGKPETFDATGYLDDLAQLLDNRADAIETARRHFDGRDTNADDAEVSRAVSALRDLVAGLLKE